MAVRAMAERRMRFVDIAANLTDGMFRGEYNGTARHASDRGLVLRRARDAGVVRAVVCAGSEDDSLNAIELIKDVRQKAGSDGSGSCLLFSTVGVHPTRSSNVDSDAIDRLVHVIEQNRDVVVAVGETGLDYDRLQFCDVEPQKKSFALQLALAKRVGLPMLLHNRNTDGDFEKMVRENRSEFTHGVVHSFTGDREELDQLLDLDLYIGVNGCSLKTPENLEVAAAIPLDRLMLETDCPYCEIRPSHAGSGSIRSRWSAVDKKKYALGEDTLVKGRSEPCQIRQVCEVLAAARCQDTTESKNSLLDTENDIAAAAFNNSMHVFFPSETSNIPNPYVTALHATTD